MANCFIILHYGHRGSHLFHPYFLKWYLTRIEYVLEFSIMRHKFLYELNSYLMVFSLSRLVQQYADLMKLMNDENERCFHSYYFWFHLLFQEIQMCLQDGSLSHLKLKISYFFYLLVLIHDLSCLLQFQVWLPLFVFHLIYYFDPFSISLLQANYHY